MTTTSPIDPSRLLLTGENPYIRLSETDGGEPTSDASFWRILFSPGGPGHVLFLQSELTGGEPRVYTDNIQMTRWLQGEIQGRINATFGDLAIPATEASFRSSGDLRSYWTEWVNASGEEIALTWYDLGEPFLSHSFPGGNPERPPRSFHGADSGQRRPAHHQRPPSRGPSLPPAARRPHPQHLCVGVLGIVDAALLTQYQTAWQPNRRGVSRNTPGNAPTGLARPASGTSSRTYRPPWPPDRSPGANPTPGGRRCRPASWAKSRRCTGGAGRLRSP